MFHIDLSVEKHWLIIVEFNTTTTYNTICLLHFLHETTGAFINCHRRPTNYSTFAN